MGRSLDYGFAKRVLTEEFNNAEKDFKANKPITVSQRIAESTTLLFSSSTQAFREALLGCVLAHIIDPDIDIKSPYMNQAENAFNGRTLDERVINPFLQDQTIPSSKAPYLSTFRRNVRFEPETAKGLRDKDAYGAMLYFLDEVEDSDEKKARELLRYLLYSFIKLRDASQITLVRIHRLSMEQYERLINSLLQVPSGGLMPVLLSVAMFSTIKNHFNLPWEIHYQGINVADRASGVGGDITISHAKNVILAIEVTERPIDRSRVISTFNTKIAPHGIDDYLFFFSSVAPEEDAKIAVRQYFAQGHDISFLSVQDWIMNSLGTVGAKGRSLFTKEFLHLLDNNQISATLKLAWNNLVKEILAQ